MVGQVPALSRVLHADPRIVYQLVERWFAELTNKRIRRSVKQLEAAICEYIDVPNEDPKPFVWTRTADQILDSIARYARRTGAVQPPQFIARIIGTVD